MRVQLLHLQIQYFTNLTRWREEREENHLYLRGIAPSREAES
jgi:hypothetical protein